MLAKLRCRIRRPRSATVIAFLALVFAMGGGAVAKQVDKNEVAIQTTTGGPVQTVNPSDGDSAEIPLTDPTFTQKAGEVALVSVDFDIVSGPSQGDTTCDLTFLFGAGTGSDENDLGFELKRLARRGDFGIKTGDSQALPAPAADREVTMTAMVAEEIPPDEDGNEVPDEGQCDSDTYEVSVDVSITTLRN